MNIITEDTEMKWYPAGWDFGNSEADFVTQLKGGEVKKLAAPTAFTRVDLNAMQNLGVERSEEGKLIIQMEDEAVAYAFGEYALMQNPEPWNGRGDDLRYASRYALRALLLSAATVIPDKEFGLYVVAGLPAQLYIHHPEIRDHIKARLQGKHTFTIDGKTQRSVEIVAGPVVMEGAGALIGEPGLTRTTESGSVDIGGGTTDLYAQRGAAPLTDFCKGKPVGVETATEIVKKAFANKYKRNLTDSEARDLIRAYPSTSKKKVNVYPSISVYGNEIKAEDLHALVHGAVEAVAEEIAGFVVSTWKDGTARLNPIKLIGGGAFFFNQALKTRIPHISKHEDPVFANASGYLKLATRKLSAFLQERREAEKAEKAARVAREAAASFTEE